MRRKSMLSLALAGMLLVAAVGWFNPTRAIGATSTPSAAEYQATIAALQTQVASPGSPQSPSTPTAAATAKPSKPKTETARPYLSGNAFPLLHHGKKHEISIVGTGVYDGTSIPLIIRNNTGKAVIRIQVTGVARSADGKLLASGGDQGFGPNLVHPGEYAIGYVYFGGAQLPPDATFTFETSSTDATDNKYENIRDLTITEADNVDGRIVGFLQNDYKETVSGPIGVDVMCIGGDGSLLGFFQGFTNKDSAKSGEKVPFQVDTYGQVDCTNFLVTGKGYSF
jgi:hypothetical protein